MSIEAIDLTLSPEVVRWMAHVEWVNAELMRAAMALGIPESRLGRQEVQNKPGMSKELAIIKRQ